MQGGIPQMATMNILPGLPMGGSIVDLLASVPEQRIWHVLRHEQDFTAAMTAGTVDFFNVVTAAAIDGNVERAGTIPEPQVFFVFGVSLRIQATIPFVDAQLLADSLYLEIWINNRREFGPLNLTHFPAGGGLQGACATAVGGAPLTIENISNGMPSAQFLNWFPVPLVEKGGEIFRYPVTIGNTLAAISATKRVECAQHGMLFRRATSQ